MKGATGLLVGELTTRPVSIHAPVKGATRASSLRGLLRTCFNPRPREGGDPLGWTDLDVLESFNPRPREGGDVEMAKKKLFEQMFQSTPP